MSQQPSLSGPLAAALSRDLVSNSDRLIQTRWIAGAAVVLTTAVCVRLLTLPLPEGQLYLLGAIILAYNVLLAQVRRRICAPPNPVLANVRRLVIVQIGLDWLSMALLLHFTGGVTSPAAIFFLLHILMVTILLPGQSPYVYAALALGVITLIALLEGAGSLPHYVVIPHLPADLHTNALYILAQLAFLTVTFFATVYITIPIMSRLRTRERQIAALFQAIQDVSSTLDIAQVLERLVRDAAQALDVPGASVRLLEEGSEQLDLAAAYGLSPGYLKKGPVDLRNSPVDRDALAGQTVIVDQTLHHPRLQYPAEMAAENIHSLLVVPIQGRQRPLGVLRAYANRPGRFGADDVELLLALARQSAAAIENALAHDALRRANQERAQFVRMVTHELRSPVTSAQSLMRVLLRDLAGELTERQRDLLARVENRLDLLLTLINDLLALAAEKAADLHEPLAPLPLLTAIREAVERQTPQANEKGVMLRCDLPDNLVATVYATKDGLARIFDNLIGNAVKYTPSEGNVTVSAQVQSGSARITITDTGIGILPEDLARLGEEFFRASNARQAGIPGTGLGLAIVRQLVERFGGLLSIQSTVGTGTTVSVILPLHEQA